MQRYNRYQRVITISVLDAVSRRSPDRKLPSRRWPVRQLGIVAQHMRARPENHLTGKKAEGSMSLTADVVVIGGGVNGTSTAFHLAQRGLRVTLLERGA